MTVTFISQPLGLPSIWSGQSVLDLRVTQGLWQPDSRSDQALHSWQVHRDFNVGKAFKMHKDHEVSFTCVWM